jgi:phage tail tape-measure protein
MGETGVFLAESPRFRPWIPGKSKQGPSNTPEPPARSARGSGIVRMTQSADFSTSIGPAESSGPSSGGSASPTRSAVSKGGMSGMAETF